MNNKLYKKNLQYEIDFQGLIADDLPVEDGRQATGFAMILQRRLQQYVVNVYMPTFLLVLLSFISFLIPSEIVPGRMALLVTIFLTIVNIGSAERAKGPRVSVFGTNVCFLKQTLLSDTIFSFLISYVNTNINVFIAFYGY